MNLVMVSYRRQHLIVVWDLKSVNRVGKGISSFVNIRHVHTSCKQRLGNSDMTASYWLSVFQHPAVAWV